MHASTTNGYAGKSLFYLHAHKIMLIFHLTIFLVNVLASGSLVWGMLIMDVTKHESIYG